MNMLAIDTSTWSLALAIMAEDRLLGELNTTLPKNHSLRLMPAIEQLLGQVELKPKELGQIAVAHGPGSYTGIRIGLTTAKSLAWSLGIPLASISSLHVVAQNGCGFHGKIIPMFDARRGQVYTGVYMTNQAEDMVIPVEVDRLQLVQELLTHLEHEEGPCLFLGEGVPQHAQEIIEKLGDRAVIAPAIGHAPRGSQLAYLARKTWAYSEREVHSLTPEYLQLAEAERKWLSVSASSATKGS